ncbi:MAG: arginine--tRNA ligase [Bacteroidales bacterium]|nr:arginine--tRNA ligase [Bacteroidales bacterium]
MIEDQIKLKTGEAIKNLYGKTIDISQIQLEKTNREHKGDFTLIVFPLLRFSKKSPQETATEIGNFLQENMDEIVSYEVIKGFLNLTLNDKYWIDFFLSHLNEENFGFKSTKEKVPFVVEYSSPNTNKPLHLGHIRNNLLGYSISEILKANGKNVVKINLVNDRGIHICKSMLAWINWGNGETPESSGLKGDHLIGKYYVLFDKKHKKEIKDLVHRGYTEDDAFSNAPLMKEAQELLQKWENADEDTLTIWRLMNDWAYDGFNETYKRLGVDFDKTNYESSTYLQGRDLVEEGLENNVFYRMDDGSVWVDLKNEKLDEKLLLRSDGTSVYMTQDIGTAHRRYEEYHPEKLVYVVGNEQIYHFDVLKKIIQKMGGDWFDIIYHLSYGMVELPQGRMKSREGKVVDADDLMDEMFETAKKTTEELGKTETFTKEELTHLYNIVGLGALKYYILRVDPKKNMLFNPEESIDFNGNTGPFIQYTYARIQSIFRKAEKGPEEFLSELDKNKIELLDAERDLIKLIYEFPQTVENAGESLSPALIANYCFELVKSYNSYYQDTPILKRVDPEIANFRLVLSWLVSKIIKNSMGLLGIEVPERM